MKNTVTLNQLVEGSSPSRGTNASTAEHAMKQPNPPVKQGQTDDLFAQLLNRPVTQHSQTQDSKTATRPAAKPAAKNRVQLCCGGIKAISPEYLGRNWKLFKRSGYQALTDPWHIWIEWKGRRVARNTAQIDPEAAWSAARLIIDAVIGNDDQALADMSLKQAREPKQPKAPAVATATTLGDVLTAYENATDIEVSESARKRNAQCLRNIVRKALAMAQPEKTWTTAQRKQLDDQTNTITLDRLTEDLAGDLRLACSAVKDGQSDPDKNKIERTWASLIAQGLSVFKAVCLHKYKKQGLIVPECVQQFHKASREQFDMTKKADYYPPADSVIDATITAWQQLRDRDMFIKIGLELACGLRDGECEQLRWGMFTVKDGEALLDTRLMPEVAMHVKGKTGEIVVNCLDPYWAMFVKRVRAEKWKGKADEPLLTACTDREVVKSIDPKTGKERTETKAAGSEHLLDGLTRQINAWMRTAPHIWTTAKTNHALRAFIGSQIIAKWGPYAAQRFLRHASIETTESHYSYFVKHGRFKPESINISWGKAAL
jgi:hypothetical protein